MPDIRLTVHRFTPGSDVLPRFDRHTIVVGEKASVLDALFALQHSHAPDLAFRFSCRVGMCGSCAMVVNGRERLTCSTLITPLGPAVRVEPLRNLPIIRDLVVDLSPLFDAYRRVMPHFIPRDDLTGLHVLSRDGAEWQAMDHQPQCIDCGACFSACSVVTLDKCYVGPMALHRALNLIADPRDAAREDRMQIIAGADGIFRCHTLGNCRDVCPRGISPTASIERLKRLAVRQQIRRWLTKLRAPASAGSVTR